MARFRAWIQGAYGNQASRTGDEAIVAEITAEKVGVYVVGGPTEKDKDQDEFFVYATRGRRERGDTLAFLCLGRVSLSPEGRVSFEPEGKEA